MLEEIALVIKSTPDQLWLETETRSSCTHCSSSQGCGTSVLAKLFSVKRNQLNVENSLGAKSGEKVIIGLPDELLVRAAIWAYLLPLISMVLVTIVASVFGAGEGMQSLLGLLGLAVGFIVVRRHTNGERSQQRFKPRLLRMAHQVEMPVKY
ncbi:MAG: SoxR reducing system RseC family protein [gamma proteobacterium symbiont of Bathyaustriella thionipta]|nr:SoxR reducing system RseC family protein [gamma proteobacterium symbiont of Bathyaustriella thionipta]MCU7950910.1 SoxR reducing system RseC family protein [gamma proteobacterium symbiont of Bathyaustriella thionipta]MCU7954544.1 SoxR reducing system RseC family protein [gamma proteobacterium symbiont of Bathyaustriella thionipta]MCU7957401.1 SoxR reducing system RseC family protein [gamma proteobacterium symbiont of Bathyaustriella thionipta]MCU7968393.1 SoxR reducing system RseC family pro